MEGKKIKTKTSETERTVILLAALILAVIIAAVCIHIGKVIQENRVVLTVNGEPVIAREFVSRMNAKRAEVYQYFHEKYNAEPGKYFWSTDFNGEKPADIVKKKALDECVKIKVYQVLGKQLGLVQDISYSGYLKALKQENKRRMEVVRNNGVIYGPQQYTEEGYYSVLFTDLVHDIKDLLNERLPVTEEEIEQYYDRAIKEGLYKKVEKTEIEVIKISFSPGDEKTIELAEQKAGEIQNKYLSGKSFSDLSKEYEHDASVDFYTQIFDSSTQRSDYNPENHLFTETATSLEPGKVSDVFMFNNSFYVVKCISKTDEGFYSLDEVRQSITSVLKDEKFSAYMNNLIDKAEISVEEKIYSKMKVK